MEPLLPGRGPSLPAMVAEAAGEAALWILNGSVDLVLDSWERVVRLRNLLR